ncbi:MAG: VIT domain-containing protein [Chitinivibrionales bacterium]
MKNVIICITVMVSVFYSAASIPPDSLGEGTCVGYRPIPADTVSDTSFSVGDTLFLETGESIVYLPDSDREEAVVPSVRTKVNALILDGFAHGEVIQTFENPFDLPFDATYVFPLPFDGAVHSMQFKTSKGIYHAELMERDSAEEKFEEAEEMGMQASLLTQEQDNVFVQNICNIPGGDSVVVKTSFTMPLHYDMGEYTFVFPTKIAEDRYGEDPVDPVVSFPETRSGESIEFNILLALPYRVENLSSSTHEVEVVSNNILEQAVDFGIVGMDAELPENTEPSLVVLKNNTTVPNRDLKLEFDRENADRDLTALSYKEGDTGYFATQIYSDLNDTAQEVPEKLDIYFVIDKSGSMGGSPIAIAREVVHSMLDKTGEEDNISLLAFANTNTTLYEEPQPATQENVKAAHDWIDNLNADGGTEMLTAVEEVMDRPLEEGRKRIVALITDGEIHGVDGIYNCISQDNSNTSAFAFAVGQTTNQELIDGAATAGNGVGSFITDIQDVAPTVDDFFARIQTPQISSISIDWGYDDVSDVVGFANRSLWLGQPITLFGKYQQSGTRTVTVTGYSNGSEVSEEYEVTFASDNSLMEPVSKLWARQKIEELKNFQIAEGTESNRDSIIEVSLAYDVMSQYTAFLAVADSIKNDQGEWVAAEEYYSNNTSGTTEEYTSEDSYSTGVDEEEKQSGITGKPGLRISILGNKVSLSLDNIRGKSQHGRIEVFDLQGRLIKEWELSELREKGFSWTWDLTSLSGGMVGNGFYIINVVTDQIKLSRKIVVSGQ